MLLQEKKGTQEVIDSFINAVLYVYKTGISWRDLSQRKRFRRWSINGTWNKINEKIGKKY